MLPQFYATLIKTNKGESMKVFKYDDNWSVPVLEWKDLEKLGIKSDDVKWCKYTGGTHKNRYSRGEEPVPSIMAQAEEIWEETWRAQGSMDQGTCTCGNAIQVDVIPKRHKYPTKLNLAHAPRVQGNVSKAASRQGALNFINNRLKELFGDQIKASYYDGWMD